MKIEGLWAGTETSLKAYQDAEANMEARMASGAVDEEDTDKPYDVVNGVAVVQIKGSLTNRDSWFNAFMGVTSYNTIRDSLIQAAEDPEVAQILLDVDSGGGSVAGVADTANLIRMVNKNMKPVTSFTGGAMYSAAYWLASAAGTVYADKTAGVGSIGVIATHMSYAEQLKKEGIDATVIRAGKYKALASSVEPLTDEARAQIQKQLDSVYKVFVGHVADMRGKSYDYADDVMANGREFIGQSAMDAGLVDGIKSFDEVLATLKNSIDTSNKFIDNRANSHLGDPMKRRALSEAVIAAMAEGVLPAASADPVIETPAEPAADANALTEIVVSAEVVEAAPAAEAAAEVAAEAAPSADLVSFLQAQIKEKDAALLAANIQISDLTKQGAEASATHDGLLAIAKKSTTNMRVALGGSAVDLEGANAVAVLAEHKSLSEQFAGKFKAGGVAAVDASQVEADAKPPQDAFAQRLQNAVRFSK
jgi:signal peptide peptidase SppA